MVLLKLRVEISLKVLLYVKTRREKNSLGLATFPSISLAIRKKYFPWQFFQKIIDCSGQRSFHPFREATKSLRIACFWNNSFKAICLTLSHPREAAIFTSRVITIKFRSFHMKKSWWDSDV